MNQEKRISALSGVLLVMLAVFQVMTMMFLAYREETINEVALQFAWMMPAVSLALYVLVCRIMKADSILLLTMLFLCSVSLAILTRNASSLAHHVDQAIFMAIGLVVMLLAMSVAKTIEHWNNKAIWLLSVIALFALIVPRLFEDNNGAYNWIPLGPISVQPSEFIKVFLPIMLAHFAVRPGKGGWLYVGCIIAAAYCAILAVIQKDLGAMVIYFVVTLCLYYTGGGSGTVSVGAIAAVAVLAWVLYNKVDRVQARVEAWINPMSDPEGSGWQIIQSLIALGSAGWMGRGFGKGESYRITLYNSDGVFAAICEEFGLLFGLLLLVVYVLLTWRAITIACRTNNKFRRMVSTGISLSLGYQTMLIVAGITNLIPLTGVTLPFIASGGSSMISSMLAVGILLRYSIKEKKRTVKQSESISIW